MEIPGASTSYNSDLQEMADKFALAFINRRPDQQTVATMAPIGTDIRSLPKNKTFSESFKSFFDASYEPSFETSLDLGFAFVEEEMDCQFAGSSTALKRLFMEPYRAGPLSLFCHRVGKTIYVDLDDNVTDETFKEKVQDFNHDQGYIPYSQYSSRPGLTLYENLIWTCKEASDVWRENMGIWSSTELALDCSNTALAPMFDSYSYKIQPQHNLNGEAYIWEFHKTKMLVDSELPIFGGGNYPALTIRLSEGTGMPISVLTGVDILLDQLMHHIEETIVVHQVGGQVKKYDVVVNNQIPYLEGSEFDPLKLQTITSNMYNFLSSNMIQQGHTYWLCREHGSDELRLYDLTTICPEHSRNKHKNPFLIPVVNLMYKISCKLITETMDYRSPKVTNVAWGLLTAADKLLENAHLPEFRACINYLLAGLYLNYEPKMTKKQKKINQDNLLRGLSEEIFQGYEKFPGIGVINVDELTEVSDSDSEGPSMPQPQPRYRIPNSKLRVDAANQALDYCREALDCLEKCRHDDEEIPYVADNFDDMAAFGEHEHVTEDTVFNHLRHALLLRAATCYLTLGTQVALIYKGVKMFKSAQAGLQCCTSVLSGCPSKRHEIVAKCLIPPLTCCVVKAIFIVCTGLQDVSVLTLPYRDLAILKIANEHVNLLDKFNFSRCLTFKVTKATVADWTARLDAVVGKFLPLLAEDYSGRRKLQNKTLLEVIFDEFEAASKIAQVLTEIAGLVIKGIQNKIQGKDEREIAAFFKGAPEMTMESAVHFYDKSVELIELCPDKEEFNKIKSILLINSVVAKKVWMIVGHARKVDFVEYSKLAEEVFNVYHRAFSYMPKELRTCSGVDIHVRCLIEYSDILLIFTKENSKELDKSFPGRRKAYYEACIRNYDPIFAHHKEVPPTCLTKLVIYKTHVLYMILKMHGEELHVAGVSDPGKCPAMTRKIRQSVSKYMNFFETCLKHVQCIKKMDVLDAAKRPEPHFCRDIVPCFTSPYLSGPEKLRILKLTTAWAKAVLDIAPVATADDLNAAKEYALRATVELKSISSGLKKVVERSSEKKLEKMSNVLVLKNSPSTEIGLINVIRDKLDEAVKML